MTVQIKSFENKSMDHEANENISQKSKSDSAASIVEDINRRSKDLFRKNPLLLSMGAFLIGLGAAWAISALSEKTKI